MKNFRFDEKEHAYFLDDKPLYGVTTVISKTLPKPLTWWAAGMALEQLGWVNPKKAGKEEQMKCAIEALENIKKLEAQEYHALLQTCYRAHDERKKTRGQEGTDTHALVEEYINYCMDEHGGRAQPTTNEAIRPFAEWALSKAVRFIASEKRVYSEQYWFAGTMDFILEMDGGIFIGDLKTSKEIYPEHFIQMGAYQVALEEREPGIQIKGRIVVKLNGEIETKVSYDGERDKGLFLNCLAIHKSLQTWN